MERMANSYFKEIFTKDPTLSPDEVLDCIAPKVNAEMNDSLCKPYSDEEISNALFQIGPLKALGCDGLPTRFFQRNWALLKAEITTAVREFFVSGIMPEGVNDTAIVLIPKVPHPKDLKDFRPISLCNVIYKIVSKCMVNRLRPVLTELISENQSAFIPGRLITDNSIIAFECLHHIQSLNNNAVDLCAYKLDLSKAYDRVDWSFLEKALVKWGFPELWISRVMACVSSVKYSVKFNGKLMEAFSPSRGLRQGDPLSPFLFLFVADALSALLNKAAREDALQGITICRGAPEITHLLFADDSLLFFQASQQQALLVKGVLNTFAAATGQLINPSKCSILFSSQCSAQVIQELKLTLDISQEAFESKYLGLPVPEGRMHKGNFEFTQERLRKILVDWSEQYMSSGSKEILIKAMAQAIPAYVMSIFRLPASVCDDITRMIQQYWGEVENGKKKMAWMSWEKLRLPKSMGGLGFRDMRAFN
uniref:Reverse transcriptase domain-containing protein n=1 Tax=Hordeum vulgare subsp. vulgare TaxID=112509 RepID=A0A8I6YHP9_HORVV